MAERIVAAALATGDEVSRDGVTWKKIHRVSIGSTGNVEVDYDDGTIEDLDPSFYPYVRSY